MGIVAAVASRDAFVRSPQRKTFFAVDRHWVFYSDGSNIVWKSSVDGVTWDGPTVVRAGNRGDEFALFFDGTYVHYAWGDYDAASDLTYRRGTPVSDGTITWSAVEQIAVAEDVDVPIYMYWYPNICVDDNGNAFITWINGWGTHGYAVYATRNDNVDGTWSTTVNFPAVVDNIYIADGYNAVPVPLTSQEVYVIWGGNYYETMGKLWNPSTGWGSKEDIDNDWTYYSDSYKWISAVAIGQDVHLAVQSKIAKVGYLKRTYATSSWSTKVEVGWCVIGGMQPTIAKDEDENIYIFYTGCDLLRYIRKNADDTWEDEISLDPLTGYDMGRTWAHSTFYESEMGIGVAYGTYDGGFHVRYLFVPYTPSNCLVALSCAGEDAFGTEPMVVEDSDASFIDICIYRVDDDQFKLLLRGRNTDDLSWAYDLGGTTYGLVTRYLTLERDGADAVTLKVYSDAARLNLVETITLPRAITDDYRFLTAVGSMMEWIIRPTDHSTGYIENLDIESPHANVAHQDTPHSDGHAVDLTLVGTADQVAGVGGVPRLRKGSTTLAIYTLDPAHALSYPIRFKGNDGTREGRVLVEEGHTNTVHTNSPHTNVAHGDDGHINTVHVNTAHVNTAHGDTPHNDSAHVNTAHVDTAHGDTAHGDVAHGDGVEHTNTPHSNSGHGDVAHGDAAHGDTGHGDSSFEDFTTWAETDPDNRLSQTADRSTWTGMTRGDTASFLRKDWGSGNIGTAFTYYFTIEETAQDAGDADSRPVHTFLDIRNDGAPSVFTNPCIYLRHTQVGADDSIYTILLYIHNGTTGASDTSVNLDVGTTYYCTLVRNNSGKDVTLYIYDNIARGGGDLVDTLIATLDPFTTTFQFMFAPWKKDNAADTTDWVSGYIENLNTGHTNTAHINTAHSNIAHTNSTHSNTLHGDAPGHTNTPHTNTVHVNTAHVNTAHVNTPHADSAHINTAHSNTAHVDTAHGDTGHSDSAHSNVAHIDVAHGDASHFDTAHCDT